MVILNIEQKQNVLSSKIILHSLAMMFTLAAYGGEPAVDPTPTPDETVITTEAPEVTEAPEESEQPETEEETETVAAPTTGSYTPDPAVAVLATDRHDNAEILPQFLSVIRSEGYCPGIVAHGGDAVGNGPNLESNTNYAPIVDTGVIRGEVDSALSRGSVSSPACISRRKYDRQHWRSLR